MKKGFLVLLALSTLLYGCGLFGGKGTGHHGELTSVMDRPEWDQYQPMGMVYIPPGSYHMGQNDQDVPYSQIAHQKQVTISAFFMDETEISNNEYRQFLFGPTQREKDRSRDAAYTPLLDTLDPV